MQQRQTEKCKTTIYKVYVKKILLHGGDTKARTKKEESKTQRIEMKILIAIIRKTKSNRIGNAHIRE
jgi:hypothetical protein